MKLTISGFAGANKALHPKLVPNSAGVESLDQRPGRGDFRPWKQPLTVATVPAGRQTIYRFGRDVASDANYWFSWNSVVHAVRGYNTGDTTERTYFTGSGAPKWTDNIFGLAGAPYPTASRDLGVPAPTGAVTLSAAGGSATELETLYYVYTYVTDKNEESAPSPASLAITCKTDDTITINNILSPPAGAFTINRVRVYRTQTGDAGDTSFFFLREINSGVASTTDDRRALGEALATEEWVVPPTNLSYLTPMWNGMLAGISGAGVRFCEPFAPYAWPLRYEILPPDALPVALGRWQQNLLVLTTAKPLLVVGTAPANLDQQPLDIGEACVAARGVVSFGHGVAWPCPDGLAYMGEGGAKMLTDGLLTRDDWQAMNPSTIVAGIYEGAYFGFYTDGGAVRRAFMIDPLNPTGIFFLSAGYDALYFDELQDALYVLNGTNVQKWNAGGTSMTATFRSKVFTVPSTTFSTMRVVADAYPVTVRVDAGPFTSGQVTSLVAANTLLTASGTMVRYSVTVNDRNPVKLPSGFEAIDWQVQVETTQPVQAVMLATATEELNA